MLFISFYSTLRKKSHFKLLIVTGFEIDVQDEHNYAAQRLLAQSPSTSYEAVHEGKYIIFFSEISYK